MHGLGRQQLLDVAGHGGARASRAGHGGATTAPLQLPVPAPTPRRRSLRPHLQRLQAGQEAVEVRVHPPLLLYAGNGCTAAAASHRRCCIACVCGRCTPSTRQFTTAVSSRVSAPVPWSHSPGPALALQPARSYNQVEVRLVDSRGQREAVIRQATFVPDAPFPVASQASAPALGAAQPQLALAAVWVAGLAGWCGRGGAPPILAVAGRFRGGSCPGTAERAAGFNVDFSPLSEPSGKPLAFGMPELRGPPGPQPAAAQTHGRGGAPSVASHAPAADPAPPPPSRCRTLPCVSTSP